MHGKKRGTAVVTESAVQAALRRGPARDLAPDEERLMRMRVGASLPLSARLERIAVATDAEIELLSYEIEAFLHLKQQRAAATLGTVLAAGGMGEPDEPALRLAAEGLVLRLE